MSEPSKQSQINQLAADRDAYWRHMSKERRINSALRGQITRLKKRIVRNQCPFCGRGMIHLQRHLEADHPAMVKKYGAKK